jgi:hypothetical protein
MKDIIKNRRNISEISKDMIDINKKRPSKEELDKLIDTLNKIENEETSNDSNEKVAIKRDIDGVEQNWL